MQKPSGAAMSSKPKSIKSKIKTKTDVVKTEMSMNVKELTLRDLGGISRENSRERMGRISSSIQVQTRLYSYTELLFASLGKGRTDFHIYKLNVFLSDGVLGRCVTPAMMEGRDVKPQSRAEPSRGAAAEVVGINS